MVMEAEGAVPVRAAYSTYVPRTEDDSEDEAASEGQVEPELAEAEAASVAQAAKALTISTAEDETGGEGAEGEAVAVVPSTETKSAGAKPAGRADGEAHVQAGGRSSRSPAAPARSPQLPTGRSSRNSGGFAPESSEAAGARRLAKERESFLKEVNAPAPAASAPRVKRAPQMPKPVVIPPDVANVPRLRRRALASALHQLL